MDGPLHRRTLQHPEFREQFKWQPQQIGHGHPTDTVALPGGEAEIDRDLAPATAALNAAGVRTANCCQGGAGATAYITLASGAAFPPEFVASWSGAGFFASSRDVYALAPFGLEDEAAAGFRRSLADWIDGNLDRTGERYGVRRPRPNSLPALPVSCQKSEAQSGSK